MTGRFFAGSFCNLASSMRSSRVSPVKSFPYHSPIP